GSDVDTDPDSGSDVDTDTDSGSDVDTDSGSDSDSTPTDTPDPVPTGTPDNEEGGSSSSSSSSSSGSSNIGSGVSAEPASNIEIKELATRNVMSGYHIKYEFPKNVTCITYIEYDAERTFRRTTTIAEVLKGKSTLVPKLPSGRIYKHVNIWVGNQGAGLPTSLKNGLVGFKVEKEWIEDNNVNESLITLQWYNKGWKPLPTEKVSEDEDYVYFKAKTPGYSSFAITEYQEGKIQQTLRNLENEGKLLLNGSAGQNGVVKKPMEMAKIFMIIALPLFALIIGYGVLKKKI
ncbi:MAG: PGF-pre-PGF domain-containing protein, partial [Methanosarcina sp.]|nr:PGF-pre-PGF domain-containing protein [Methanosarcina sp.]